ncbi:Eco57I restriction-modification methylase domain-containing protein [uncultured Prevotella sp.]|uniref:Eco57I restriction-modification methylase domain-containing protein n=1 Tax=uncultured Prevotella sp. TaxID=159272 RepID=UPI00266C7717|nr:Eco57I restriction-modification methylase domain-containing protein [uncultured Prevotella sp.]
MDSTVIDKYIVGRVEPHIYAFTTGTVPNYLKVGDTYRPIEQRLNEWRKYFPDLEKAYSAISKVDENVYFRDFAIHSYLERDKKLHRLMPADIDGLPYYSNEFFEHASEKDVEEAVEDIKTDFAENKGKYQFYTFDERPTPKTFTYKRGDIPYELRPNQAATVSAFTKAVSKGRTNLLMYAVMRFGKTFTALSCALSDKRYNAILVVSGKVDVKNEWKKTVESIKNFENFCFIDTDTLARNSDAIKDCLQNKQRAVVFLTLQDLIGEDIKTRHVDIFNRIWDMLIIDETHYGARAEEYGKVLRGSKAELRMEAKYADTSDDYDNNEELKRLRSNVRLHLSGTPYRILMGSEFQKEDIIAFYQFSDIVKDKEKWDREHIDDDDINEWDNPYYGFPQMVRFAFCLNESSIRKIEQLRKEHVEYALNELLRPKSLTKNENGLHKRFVCEQEVLDLLMAIDGSKQDGNILAFLDDKRIKDGMLCRHIVMVLPYRASCDAVETMINEHKNEFRCLGEYELLNISGVDNERLFKNARDVNDKIEQLENRGVKTITLTVNRMLTGTTIEQWDTMIYLKDTVSPQDYDQAIFRLQNQYVREFKDEDGNVMKYNMKPQTLLVDFEPGRMFRMQESKSQIYNINIDKKGNSKLTERIAEELRISPIIVVNKDKMCEVEPNDILEAVNAYSANKSIMDEATDIPVDEGLLANDDIVDVLKTLYPIGSKKGIKIPAYKGSGDDIDTEDASGDKKDDAKDSSEKERKDNKEEEENLLKKLSTYYSLILFFAFLTNSKVASVDDILKVIDSKTNRRIARNVGIDRDVLLTIRLIINPFVLSELDYKVAHMNRLSHDDSIPASERVDRAMKKFGRLSTSEVVTPVWVADKMVGYLPADRIKKGTKILDIASKQGEFANALYKAFGNKIKNTIYSLPTSSLTYEFTRKVYELLGLPVKNVIEDYNSYDLLNSKKKEKIMNEFISLGTDIIIGNPPYQDDAVGEQKTYNGPIYNHYLDCAYIISDVVEMIHPARFLSNAGSTPKAWNKKMLEDKHFGICEFWNKSVSLFDETDIKGGIVISLRDKKVEKGAIGLFTPYQELNAIVQSVCKDKKFKSMSDIVVSRTAYRFTDLMHKEHPEAMSQLSNGHPYDVSTNIFERLPQVFFGEKPNDCNEYIRIIGRIDNARIMKYVRRDYIREVENLDGYKVFMAKANGTGAYGETLTPPIVGEPAVGNTESFISIGNFCTGSEASALMKYISTKFVRALLGALKTTQDITPEKWKFVPQQDFSEASDIDWSLSVEDIDALLYKKYNLTDTEIRFINEKVQAMS